MMPCADVVGPLDAHSTGGRGTPCIPGRMLAVACPVRRARASGWYSAGNLLCVRCEKVFKTRAHQSAHPSRAIGEEGRSVHPSIHPFVHSSIHPIHPRSIILSRNPTSQPGPSRVLPPALRPRHPGLPTTSFDSISVSCPGSCCVLFGPGSLSRSRLTAHGSGHADRRTSRTHHASRLTLDPFLSSIYRFCFWPCSSLILTLILLLSLHPSLTTNSPPRPRSTGRFRLRFRLRPSARVSLSVSLRLFRPDRDFRRIPSFLRLVCLRPKEEQTANPPSRPVSTR